MLYAIYLRKSRADLEAEAMGQGETLARHRAALLDYAAHHGLEIGAVYEEIISGESIDARPKMKQLLREVESAKQQLSDLGSAQQNVKVGIPPLWGTTFFPDLLHDFNARHPNIRLTFYEYGSARAAALVKEKELDIALANLNQDDPESFQSACIGRDHFVIVVDPAHPLAKRDSVALEDLAATPLVMYNTDSVQNNAILSRFESLGITPYIQIYTSQIYTMKGMIHNSTCASFFYASLLEDHPDLVGIPIEPRIEQKVGLLWRKSKYTPSGVESFISFVRDYPLFPEEP